MDKILFSSNSDEWETPNELFLEYDKIYNFDLDCCADESNKKCEKYYSKEQDALKIEDWEGKKIWCNPPYSRRLQDKFIKKCYEESKKGKTCVLLIPARTDKKIWHEIIFTYAYKIIFLKGRLKFSNSKNSAPFPSAIIIFGKEVKNA